MLPMIVYQLANLPALFDTSSAPIGLIDPAQGNAVYANQAFLHSVKHLHVRTGQNLLTQIEPFLALLQQCQREQRFQCLELPAPAAIRVEMLPVECQEGTACGQKLVQCQIFALAVQAAPSGTAPTEPLGFERILDYFPHSTWVCSLQGAVFWTNRASNLYAYGKEVEFDLSNARYLNRIHPDDLSLTSRSFSRAMLEGKLEPFRYRLINHRGEVRWFLFTGAPVLDGQGHTLCWTGASIDIEHFVECEREQQRQMELLQTKNERLLEQLSESQALLANVQRFDLVTHLAAGIAHDLNNLLFVMGLNLGSLQRRVEEPELLNNVSAIRDSVKKAARLSSQLSGFSGRLPQNATTLRPDKVAEDLHDTGQ